jgi:hypothetical protein
MNQKEKEWLKNFFYTQADLLHDINNGILLVDSAAWHIIQSKENVTNHGQQHLNDVQHYAMEETVPKLQECSKKLRCVSQRLNQCYRNLQAILET